MSHDALGISPLAVLRRISADWTPADATFALLDNAVEARARNVWVHIRKHEERFADTRRDNVAAYEVVDDGHGMDPEAMRAALSLAAGKAPSAHSLSKFGLGLKAAAQSQGDELHLVSSPGGGAPFERLVVRFDAVTPDRYFATREPLTPEDDALIREHLPGGRGTLVRIARIRLGGHPSIRTTVRTLRERADVVYYYFLRDGLNLVLHGEPVAAYDVLHTAEADAHDPLNEHTWDGRTARWIKRPERITLDAEQGVEAEIEVTQLPHPPTFDLDTPPAQTATRNAYRIGSANYGYYVYRNRRLIAWAERFEGVVPQATQQDMFSFRGRLLIDESADEAFNIDLKKSHIQLSDEASETLSTLTDAYARKSRKAWNTAKAEKKRHEGKEPNKRSNELAADFEPPVLPEEAMATPEEAAQQAEREAHLEAEAVRRARREAARQRQRETGRPVSETDLTEEEVRRVARGTENPAASRIFRVERTEDNALWEPYWDTDHGWSVRIDALHGFGRLVFEDNQANADLQVLFELFLLTLAQAEAQVQKATKLPVNDAERLLGDFRRAASSYLAKLCLDLRDRLPPLDD